MTSNMGLLEILDLLKEVRAALLPRWRELDATDKAKLADTIYHVEEARESLIDFIYR